MALASPWHGVIEGFYGEPYSHLERLEWLAFLEEVGLDTYVYAPKDDPFHRALWREPYPAAELAQFGELAAEAQARGLRFVFAISPGLDFDPESGDEAALLDKVDAALAVGVRHVCVFFDDVEADAPGADPAVQVAAIRAVHTRVGAAGGDVCFVGNYYFGSADALGRDEPPPFVSRYPRPPTDYYEAYRALPPEVPVFWTGRHVFSSEVPAHEMEAFRAFARRPVLLWDNVPVNDLLLSDELFLGAWSRDAALAEASDGIVLNLMTQSRASRVLVETAAEAIVRGGDPQSAWDRAIDRAAGGAGRDALARMARQFRGHPFVGDGEESVVEAAAMAAYLEAPSESTAAALRSELEALARLDADLDALGDPVLREELRPGGEKASALAAVALTSLEALEAVRLLDAPVVDAAALSEALSAARESRVKVGENTYLAAPLASLVADQPAHRVDVYGAFVQAAMAALD